MNGEFMDKEENFAQPWRAVNLDRPWPLV